MLNSQSKGPTHGTAATVLLIEDEAAIRNLVSRFLTMKGFRILSAENSDEARVLWRKHKDEINLLLADIVMAQGLSGGEVAAEFRAENSRLKVLFTSGFNLEGTLADDSAAQMNFIPKPYRPEQLLAAIQRVLKGN